MRSRLIVVSSVLIAAWIAACGSDGSSIAPGDSGDAGNDGTTTPTSDAAGDGCSATDAPTEGSVGPAADGSDFPRWSSTVTRISGTIAAGEKLALEVPAAPGRTFKPKVTELETARRNFLALVSDARPELHRYCARLTGSVIEGEDIVEDTLAKALKHTETRADFDDVAGFVEPSDPSVMRAALATFLELPVSQRSAVILKDVLGHSLEETAATMGTTVPAVKSALVRGRAALRASADDCRLDLVSKSQRSGKAVGMCFGNDEKLDVRRRHHARILHPARVGRRARHGHPRFPLRAVHRPRG